MGKKLLSLSLVGVMVILILMDVSMVKCFADGGRHLAIETIGHQNTVSTCDSNSSCGDKMSHAHEHPSDCIDKPIVDGVLYQRSVIDCDSLTKVFAISHQYYDIGQYLDTDPNYNRRARIYADPLWPHSSIDDFLTIRLLI